MTLIAFVFVMALFCEAVFSKQPPSKTPEDELGAAVAKYLSKGVKVRCEEKK
jgi:hypothetical protein